MACEPENIGTVLLRICGAVFLDGGPELADRWVREVFYPGVRERGISHLQVLGEIFRVGLKKRYKRFECLQFGR